MSVGIDSGSQTLVYSRLPIRATLHPNETYDPEERAALAAIEADNPRFRVVDLPMDEALGACDCVVTENSGAGFHAIFFGKPVILFAGIDYHHICLKVSELGVEAAFQRVAGHTPDYAAYLLWFWNVHALDLTNPDCADLLARRLEDLGVDASGSAADHPIGVMEPKTPLRPGKPEMRAEAPQVVLPRGAARAASPRSRRGS